MQTIWKFPIEIKDEQTIEMPGGSKILCVNTQGPELVNHHQENIPAQAFLWAVVDPKAAIHPVQIYIYGTGNPAPNLYKASYIGTFQQFGGALVWHVFGRVGL